jgi:hypothetical protein
MFTKSVPLASSVSATNGRFLRIAGAIYVTAKGERVVVLHAFVKKAQKTTQRALEIARERAKEVPWRKSSRGPAKQSRCARVRTTCKPSAAPGIGRAIVRSAGALNAWCSSANVLQ